MQKRNKKDCRKGGQNQLQSVKSKDRPERKICRTQSECQIGYGFWYIAAAASYSLSISINLHTHIQVHTVCTVYRRSLWTTVHISVKLNMQIQGTNTTVQLVQNVQGNYINQGRRSNPPSPHSQIGCGHTLCSQQQLQVSPPPPYDRYTENYAVVKYKIKRIVSSLEVLQEQQTKSDGTLFSSATLSPLPFSGPSYVFYFIILLAFKIHETFILNIHTKHSYMLSFHHSFINLQRDNANRRIPVSHKSPQGI